MYISRTLEKILRASSFVNMHSPSTDGTWGWETNVAGLMCAHTQKKQMRVTMATQWNDGKWGSR
jgi:hypothetical protein